MVLACVFAAVAEASAQAPPDAGRPVYSHRLDLPVAADTLLSSDAVTADPATGEVFVCDSRWDRIVLFDAEGLYRHQIVGGDVFSSPRDLAVDPDGRLVVLATHGGRTALVELDFDGLFLREVALSGLPEGTAEPNLTSLALSPAGDRLYAVDVENLALWIAGRDGAVVGSVDLGKGLDEGAPARGDRFLGRVDVYGDRVLVAVPSEGQVWLFGLDGEVRGRLGAQGTSRCQLAAPNAAALTADGHAVVLDQQKMLLSLWALSGNRCLGEHYGIGAAPGFLYFPHDLALDARGRAYVTQGFEGRVQVYEGLGPALGRDVAPEP
ncbi:MAG TPA: hypothetical protein VLF66_05495 [Thermoanaerobaculia bacterium]|nr:hypothetical protein [Thermoanaerobaculia bacterium]